MHFKTRHAKVPQQFTVETAQRHPLQTIVHVCYAKTFRIPSSNYLTYSYVTLACIVN